MAKILCVRIGEKYGPEYETYLEKKLPEHEFIWIREPYHDQVTLQWNKMWGMQLDIDEPICVMDIDVLLVNDYKKVFDYDCDSLRPCLSWINKSTKFSEHRYHSHPNSFLSAIYYISTNPTSTYFESPNTSIYTGIVVNSKSKFNQNVWSSQAKSGDLIIFPSTLYHWTQPENFDGERLTLSLNIMPTGIVNENSLIEFKYI